MEIMAKHVNLPTGDKAEIIWKKEENLYVFEYMGKDAIINDYFTDYEKAMEKFRLYQQWMMDKHYLEVR